MILSDREIRIALLRGTIQVAPPPREDAWSSTALDLTLGQEISRWKLAGRKGAKPPPFWPNRPDFDVTTLLKQHGETIAIPAKGFKVVPNAFLLGWTEERIQLPHFSRLAARVEGKSSLARLGLGIHVTAPTIHAGFGVKEKDPNYPSSPLQLEIWNFGPLEIE
jgi:dCTP deaminase